MSENENCQDNRMLSKVEVKFKFALRNQKIISIENISAEEKGLACNCVCPQCNAPLQAKIGTGKRQRHFSHVGEACQIELVQQTALHIMAKEIIEEEKCICFPGITISRDEIPEANQLIDDFYKEYFEDSLYSNWNFNQYFDEYAGICNGMPCSYTSGSEATVLCDSVVLEKRIQDIVPDVVITKKGKECLIEIAVTHHVDEVKQKKLRLLNLPVLEIDLRELYQCDFTRDEVRDIIKSQTEKKKWVYHPRMQQAIKEARAFYLQDIQASLKQLREDIKREEKARNEKDRKRANAQNKLNRLWIPANYRSALLDMRNDSLAYDALRGRSFYRTQMRIPFYMDVPIEGEMIFNCDRRIWQSAIFDKFVYNRIEHDGEPITLSVIRIKNWVLKHQKEFSVDWELMPKVGLIWIKPIPMKFLLEHVVMQYLICLDRLGFVGHVNEYNMKVNVMVCATHTIEPPNFVGARQMEKDLQSVDTLAIDVQEQIQKLPLI